MIAQMGQHRSAHIPILGPCAPFLSCTVYEVGTRFFNMADSSLKVHIFIRGFSSTGEDDD